MNLSMCLIGVISQQLIPNTKSGLSLALEILINTSAIKALIRENNIHQVESYLMSGAKDGMIKMDDSLLALYNDNNISKEEALNYAINPADLSKRLSNISI